MIFAKAIVENFGNQLGVLESEMKGKRASRWRLLTSMDLYQEIHMLF